MLFNIEGKQITKLPHKDQFTAWRRRLSDADYQRAADSIKSMCEAKDFVVSSFLPGSDWTGTEFQPLYFACGQSMQQSGLFFGLIVWKVMMDDDAEWCFLPADKGGDDVLGMRYFPKPK
ncbi:MAG: hypothetical protein NT031_11810 [Planctomycetota bacterium]|nr:hypothetical protein [Planctomycetota bacterium]